MEQNPILSETQKKIALSHSLFRGLSEEDFAFSLAFLHARPALYRKGDFLHRMGEQLHAFGLLLSGNVGVYTDDMDGKCMMMANVCPGESFGESLCYLRIKQAPIYILAAEDSAVLWLDAGGLSSLSPGDDMRAFSLAARFSAALAMRTLDMNDRIQILSQATVKERVVAFLSRARRRYGSDTFSVPFDRASLAVYLAVNRSALSRTLSEMKKAGEIDFYRNTFRLLHPGKDL